MTESADQEPTVDAGPGTPGAGCSLVLSWPSGTMPQQLEIAWSEFSTPKLAELAHEVVMPLVEAARRPQRTPPVALDVESLQREMAEAVRQAGWAGTAAAASWPAKRPSRPGVVQFAASGDFRRYTGPPVDVRYVTPPGD